MMMNLDENKKSADSDRDRNQRTALGDTLVRVQLVSVGSAISRRVQS
jgi:hypothetical protein